MNFLYLTASYILLIIISNILEQKINVTLNQRYGPKNKMIYLGNSLLGLFNFLFFLAVSICINFVFYFFGRNSIYTLISIFCLLLFFPIYKNKKYCGISCRFLSIVIFFISYLSVINYVTESKNYVFYSPFTVIVFIVAIINNMLFANSKNYSLKIIRLTCLNFITVTIFFNHNYYLLLLYVLILNIFQIIFEKLYPKINVLLSIKIMFIYLFLPVLFSLVLNYIWFYFFGEKSLLYFMGF